MWFVNYVSILKKAAPSPPNISVVEGDKIIVKFVHDYAGNLANLV